ncbi:hypothetical protein QBC35DRAFT_298314 [Podospora australis]|uniref:Uncharacterized protein n=1 Tax=Podospora australis TaxID=1536484 RepID=A0AAN6WQ71_9PEZI|nr:hypothetical protein QBC35DRAFT_298314 [Podospora australis]
MDFTEEEKCLLDALRTRTVESRMQTDIYGNPRPRMFRPVVMRKRRGRHRRIPPAMVENEPQIQLPEPVEESAPSVPPASPTNGTMETQAPPVPTCVQHLSLVIRSIPTAAAQSSSTSQAASPSPSLPPQSSSASIPPATSSHSLPIQRTVSLPPPSPLHATAQLCPLFLKRKRDQRLPDPQTLTEYATTALHCQNSIDHSEGFTNHFRPSNSKRKRSEGSVSGREEDFEDAFNSQLTLNVDDNTDDPERLIHFRRADRRPSLASFGSFKYSYHSESSDGVRSSSSGHSSVQMRPTRVRLSPSFASSSKVTTEDRDEG